MSFQSVKRPVGGVGGGGGGGGSHIKVTGIYL